MHVYVLAMVAASRALATLLPPLSGQSVVLLSDNTMVVTSLQHQDRTVFCVQCRMAAKVW